MKPLVYALIILLLILHQDVWFWDDSETVVFGFIPVGLAYHAGVSVAAAILWAMAVRFCWPAGVDETDPVTGQGGRCPDCGASGAHQPGADAAYCPRCGARLEPADPDGSLAT